MKKVIERLQNRLNRSKSEINDCDRRVAEIGIIKARLLGEVSALEDAIDTIKNDTPETPEPANG